MCFIVHPARASRTAARFARLVESMTPLFFSPIDGAFRVGCAALMMPASPVLMLFSRRRAGCNPDSGHSIGGMPARFFGLFSLFPRLIVVGAGLARTPL